MDLKGISTCACRTSIPVKRMLAVHGINVPTEEARYLLISRCRVQGLSGTRHGGR